MKLRLYVIPGSHPCECVEAALRLKSLPYDRTDMIPVMHRLQGKLSYGARTAPGLKIDGQSMAGSRAILRRLDEMVPEPRLYPAADSERERIEQTEQWGDEVLQPLARRLAWAVLKRHPRAMESYSSEARLPIPISLARPSLPLLARLAARLNGATEEVTREDLRALPGHLERIDGWVAEGLIGGAVPNAADLQLGSSLRLLRSIGDLRGLIDLHPAAKLAGYFPPMVGQVPADVLPAGWVPAAA